MRTLTIVAVALMVGIGTVAGQTQRPERQRRERAALEQRMVELRARYHELVEELSRVHSDRRPAREIREIERALERARLELQEAAAGHEPRMIEEMLALDRALQEQHVRTRDLERVLERQHMQEIEQRGMVERLNEAEAETAMRAIEESEALHRRLAEVQMHVEQAEQRALHTEELARVQQEMQRTQRMNRADLERRRRELAEALERMGRVEERMPPGLPFESFDVEARLDRLYGDGPRGSWAPQDPADSLWRAARDRMNRRQYQDASRLFARIHGEDRYRRSAYRADALYWHAFALNRIGTRDAVRQSLELLERLAREYPAADRHADTNNLLMTVQVRLADFGSQTAIQQVREAAVADEARAVNLRAVEEIQAARIADVSERVARVNADNAIDLQRVVVAGVPSREVYVRDGVIVNPDVQSPAVFLNWGVPPGRLSSLSPQCARGESEIQLIALNSLVRMDTAAAMPVLRDVMARRDECAAPLRQSAMMIIARIRNPEGDRILVDAARNDPDTGARRTALLYLASRDEPQAVSIGAEALRTAETDEERQWALQALARMRTDRAWAVVRDYAGRSELSSETRRSAIAALSQSNDSTNTAFLRNLYSRVTDDRELKEAILMSSAFRRGGSDPEWLFAIARDAGEEPRIREFAVTALSRNEDVGTPRFIALYDGTDDKRVKLALLRVLAGRADDESQAVDKLIAIARTETDTDLRKTAVLGLPANDPRARALLLEILRGT